MTYDLNFYTKQLKKMNLLKNAELMQAGEEPVLHLEYHSKKVKPGTLFVCKGNHFKVDYLKEAIQRGAIGYVAEENVHLDEEIPHLSVSDIREAMPVLADFFYNRPYTTLFRSGIGGTKGKTTTTYFTKAVLDAYLKAQDKRPAGLISSITNYTGQEEESAENTTPEALDLQAYLADAVNNGLEYVVMEVSSQALKYHRTDRITFDVGIFLNIDEDHNCPTEQPKCQDYLESKAKMFGQTKSLLVNCETQEADYLFHRPKEAEKFYSFSVESKNADYYASDIEVLDLESHFHMHSGTDDVPFRLTMPGKFNVENAVAAIAVGHLLGIPIEYAQKALKDVEVPGRMRIMSSEDEKIIAVADFAHNRLSFENLIQSMREIYPEYKVVTIFGAPGGKALGRREELGTVAGQMADFVYLTMDDPDLEDVSDISEEIAVYVKREGTPYQIINHRTEAIQTAFKNADGKTLILVIGKGHEKVMKIDGQEVPIPSDEELIQACIERYNDHPSKE